MQDLLSNILMDSDGVPYWVEMRELTVDDIIAEDWVIENCDGYFRATLFFHLKQTLKKEFFDFAFMIPSYLNSSQNIAKAPYAITRVRIMRAFNKLDENSIFNLKSQLNDAKDQNILKALSDLNANLHKLTNYVRDKYQFKMLKIYTKMDSFSILDIDKEAKTGQLRDKIDIVRIQLESLEEERNAMHAQIILQQLKNKYEEVPAEVSQVILKQIERNGIKSF